MKIFGVILLFLIGGVSGYFLRPLGGEEKPVTHLIRMESLSEVTGKKFKFAPLIEETCGVKILEPDPERDAALLQFIPEVSAQVAAQMSQEDSPARQKRRINEVSALFENALREKIDSHPDFTCDFPKTKSGKTQRSGYPDLRVEHLPTGSVAYLDPKLFEEKSINSSFRTFYFEPNENNLKVTEDALHLLIGFPHDGKTREWTFGKPHLVDLFDLTVKLKAEFSASNRDLYQKK